MNDLMPGSRKINKNLMLPLAIWATTFRTKEIFLNFVGSYCGLKLDNWDPTLQL